MKAAGMIPLTLNAADMEALVSYVSGLGETSAASAATPPAAGSSSPAAAVNPAPANAPAGSLTGDATTARGKIIFDSQGCTVCHGESGGGGTGPALAHISSQYSATQMAAVRKGVTAVLEAPTAQMKAGGMVPLTLNAADMEALVSYVSSVGRTSAAHEAAPPASGSSPAAPATAGPTTAVAPPEPESKGKSVLGWISVFLPFPHGAQAKEEAATAAGPSKEPTGSSAGDAAVAHGKSIFDSQGCGGCHGEAGAGGSGPALTRSSSQYSPAQLTAVLKAPTAQMKAAGMVPLTVNAADMKALVSYVSSLGGTSAVSAATPPPAAGPPSPRPN
jgi:mono/diheme cytochrome c family protein